MIIESTKKKKKDEKQQKRENRNRKKKQMYGDFDRQTDEIVHEKTWTWLRKGNLKRETGFILIGEQNNAMRTS